MNASELAKMRQDRRKHSVAVVQPVRNLALSLSFIFGCIQLDQCFHILGAIKLTENTM